MSKYDKTVEQLIDKMGIAIEQCLAIIEQEIPIDISEDKMHNVLKGKRQATEDAVYYAKQIDTFEKELRGDFDSDDQDIQNKPNDSIAPLKRYTKK